MLLGQNANALLPTGGSGPHKVEGLRVRCTVLGKFGYVWDGHHPLIWTHNAAILEGSNTKASQDEVVEVIVKPDIYLCHLKVKEVGEVMAKEVLYTSSELVN